jgi:DHA2 family multidrug resistance protein
MQHFISIREQFHSNILGLSVQLGEPPTRQRLFGLTADMASRTPGLGTAADRAADILSLQVRQQAFTLAITDSFTLVAWSVVCCLIAVACMAPVAIEYRQIVKAAA